MKNKILFIILVALFESCSKDKLEPAVSAEVKGYTLTRIQSQAAFSPRDSGGGLLFKDSLWLFGGFTPDRSNEVWNSADGVQWNKKPNAIWSERNLMGVVEFSGKIWLMGGFNGTDALNDVYSSEDGINWDIEIKNAPWSKRCAFGITVLNNKLILFGGMGENFEPLNDCWESVDGVNWTLLTPNAQWSPRAMFSHAILDNEIYIIGGGIYNTDYVFNSEINFQDVWKTSNGVNWILLTTKTPFSARRFHNSFVLNNRIFSGAGFCLDPRIFPDSINGLLKSSLTPEQIAFYNQDRVVIMVI